MKKRFVNNDQFLKHQTMLYKTFAWCAGIATALMLCQFVWFMCDSSGFAWYKPLYFSGPAIVFMVIAIIIEKRVGSNNIRAYMGEND